MLDAAAELVQQQLVDRVSAQGQSLVDTAKENARVPIATMHDNAAEIAEFSLIAQQTAERAVVQLQDRVAKFSGAIGLCRSIEDIVNTVINQTF